MFHHQLWIQVSETWQINNKNVICHGVTETHMRHVRGKPEYDHGLYYQGKSMMEDDLKKKILVEISTIYVMIIYYIITKLL